MISQPILYDMDLSLCFKCRQQVGTTPSRDGVSRPYCRNCFVEFVRSTFRHAFHHDCQISPGEIVIAVDGSCRSMVLLDLCRLLRDHNQHKDPRAQKHFHLHCVFVIPEGFAKDDDTTETEMQHDTREFAGVRDNTRESNIRLARSKLRYYCDSHNIVLATVPASSLGSGECNAEATTKEWRRTLDESQDTWRGMKRQALLSYAVKISAPYIIEASCGNDLARDAILQLSIGGDRESVVKATTYKELVLAPSAVGDACEDHIIFCRPCRDLLSTEVARYAYFCNLPFVSDPELALNATSEESVSGSVSLFHTTSEFLNKVQHGFKGTIFNILNTLEKDEATMCTP